MVRCGPKAIPTRTFAMLPQLMEEDVDPHVQALLEVMPGPLRSTSSWWNASRDLGTLLRKFAKSESSDPRDAVYALLGISSNFKNNRIIPTDYEVTFEETVQNTIWALLFGEILDRSLYKLPTWNMADFRNSLQDLPGSVFDWATSVNEIPVLVRLLTHGDGPYGVQDPSSNQGLLHHKLPLHALVLNNGPLAAIQSFMPHANLDINRMSNVHGKGPLHLAAERGLESVVSALLQHPNIDVNLRGRGSVVKDILQASKYYSNLQISDPNRDEYWPDTPLNIAVVKGHPSVVKVLLQHRKNGVRVQVKNAGGTALHLAAAVLNSHPESAEVVKWLLQYEDVDVNGKNWRGNSPLNIAAIQGNDCMVKSLLQHEFINVNHVGESGSPLDSAARVPSAAIVAILIQDGRIDHGSVLRSLKRAVWANFGTHEVVKELLKGCSDQDHEILGQALVRASAFGDLPTIQMLLDKGAPTNGHGDSWFTHEPIDYQHDMTPLCAAVDNGREKAVRLLLDNNVQPDDRDKDDLGKIKGSENKKTALALAVRQARLFVVKMLLVSGASVHQKDLHGMTPLLAPLHRDSFEAIWRIPGTSWISEKGMKCRWDTQGIEILSLHGASISCGESRVNKQARNSLITTSISVGIESKWIFDEVAALQGYRIEDPLEIEIEHKRDMTGNLVDMVRALLNHGADTEARDNQGTTILWMAVCRNYVDLVDLLLSFGADTETTDSIHGRTALWVAALLDYDDIIRKLIETGANREIRCKHGKTPLCIAAEKGCGKSVKALLDCRADLHAQDSQGRTPFDLAQENGHEEIARILVPDI